ncbi:MAG: COP23 domain-containing protein, partial [Cyanobacteria bacterium J06642_3]
PEVIIDTDPNSRNDDFNRPRNPTSSRNTRRNGDTRFTCEFVDGEYVVLYNPENQASNSFPWAIPSALGGGWTPERRCNEITRRLEDYRADGLLEMSTGIENGYDTICVTTSIDPSDCRIVLTVPPGQDPQVTRDAVFENLLIADDGGATQGVYTYGDNGSANILNEIGGIFGASPSKRRSPTKINLRPFLDPSDGGTGTQLKRNVSPRKNTAPRSFPGSGNGNGNGGRKPAIFQ